MSTHVLAVLLASALIGFIANAPPVRADAGFGGALVASEDSVCGSVNPNLGYGPGPYGGSWATDHRDGRNSDWADCEINGLGWALAWTTRIEEHTNYVYPIVAPDGTIWLTINFDTPPAPDTIYMYGLDGETGEIKRELGVADGYNFTISYNPPTVDANGNLYLTQEKERAEGTACRFGDEEASQGALCADLIALDSNGDELWRADIDGSSLGLQLTSDGNIVFQTWRGTIYVVDRAPGIPAAQRVISATNSFPIAAETLPDDLTPGARICIGIGKGVECISGNIIAVHPDTDAIYNTVQGWVRGTEGSFVQRWTYDAASDTVALDEAWNTNAPLTEGSASSPDVSFDGASIFVTDFGNNVFALDATTGDSLAQTTIGYSPGGSAGTAPLVGADGSIEGSYVIPFAPGSLTDQAFVTILRYLPAVGFQTVRTFDQDPIKWRIGRSPIGGLDDRTAQSPEIRQIVIGQKTCSEPCIDRDRYFLLQLDAETGNILSETELAGDGVTGLLALADDGSIILHNKGRPDTPRDFVEELAQRYMPLASPALAFSESEDLGLDSGVGAAVAEFAGEVHALAKEGTSGPGQLYHRIIGSTDWEVIGPPTESEPALVVYQGTLWAFATDTEGQLIQARRFFGRWSSFRPVPNSPVLASGPAAAVLGERLYVFARGDGNSIQSVSRGRFLWGRWATVPGTTIDGPAAATLSTAGQGERLYLLVKDEDERLRYRSRVAGGQWSSAELLLGVTPSRPALAAFDGQLWSFIRGSNDEIYYSVLGADRWRNWSRLAGRAFAAPAIAGGASLSFINVDGAGGALVYRTAQTLP